MLIGAKPCEGGTQVQFDLRQIVRFASLAFIGDNGGMKQGAKKQGAVAANTEALHKSEWDFRQVPKDELEACYLFEYAREFFKVSATMQGLRKSWERYKNDDKGRRILATEQAEDLLRTHCPNFPLLDFDYFPTTPWQDLPILQIGPSKCLRWDLRQKAAEHVNDWSRRFRKSRFDRLYMATLRQLEPLNSPPQDLLDLLAARPRSEDLPESLALAGAKFANWNLRRPPSEHTEYGLFAINWSYSDPEIKRAFAEWLADQRKKRDKLGLGGSKTAGNRGGFKDKLNWLGALRVKKHYRFKELVDHADTNLKADAPYCHYPDLREAAERATHEIARMFPTNWNEAEWKRKKQRLAKWRVENPHLDLEFQILEFKRTSGRTEVA